MDKQTEALKLALEALAASDDFLFNYHDCEPNNEREVDAYSEVRANNMAAWEAIRSVLNEQPASKPWVGLTTNEVYSLHAKAIADNHRHLESRRGKQLGPEDERGAFFARAIEAKLREKNAEPCKPLTEDEIAELMMQTWGCASIAPRHAPAFARAIEAAHGIKENT